ncbi:Os02g0737200 [Oryza sativa Japonica Group]|uniref:Transmembrane protein n=3 Tax=Oryza TaxID=4527 RepID=A0A8J8XAS8_ORYSJ|nr:hypothetical protein OsJ_08307 [Oryza sativa Japonica Group]KAB8088815.1 hypothetical protein EE612_013543 [Oryza sativa]KAF2946860.1 hypothetical protein DAI22_02g326000 [Oryza sativa Japonica Group]BAS80815.1 Os02g0737200 [Oryza sativa Japonica Group]
MAVLIRKLVLSLIVMVMVFLVVSGTAAARPLVGQEWTGEDTAGDDSVVVRFLRQLYLHKLAGPGHSCKTYSPNGGC